MAETDEALAAEEAAPQTVRFQFHGDGREFFRIWIVNLVLTLLTLGIYSAWAKVRTKRYFYGNTELAGDRFDYLASPIAILKGRIIAVAFLGIYTLVSYFAATFSFVLFILLMLVMPFVVMRAIRFNAIMSSWRGVRFGFSGELLGACKTILLWPLFGIVTFGFGMPYAWHKQNQYLYNNYTYGQTGASTSATASDFYAVLFMVMFASMAGGFVFFVLALIPSESIALLILAGVGYLSFYVLIYVVFQSAYFCAVYNNVHIKGNRLQTDVTITGLFAVVLPNTIFTILTLGLYYPWAAVRLARYMQAHLWIEAVDLDDFVAAERAKESALGDEIGEAFDLGIGI
jgi:uncharacterized membrane protein YjgN (DUF898 family)